MAGQAALLVDPLDTQAMAGSLRRIAGEADLRQALIERGYANLGRFTWDTAAARVIEVLETAMSRA